MQSPIHIPFFAKSKLIYSASITGIFFLVCLLTEWPMYLLPILFVVSFFAVYFTKRFYTIVIGIILLFIVSYFFHWSIYIGFTALAILIGIALYDAFLLFSKPALLAERTIPEKLSNGDENLIYLTVHNQYSFPIQVEYIDELPEQLQQRNFSLHLQHLPDQYKTITYGITPKKRGIYTFHRLNAHVQTMRIGLVQRHLQFFESFEAKVYPSIIQMKKYEFMAISNNLREYGIKKLRRIGQSQEFEQIREYVVGDDYRNINWKATGRQHQLMVNEYIDERSQRVYSIIDKGRVMKMPFEEMTLLDYSINAALAISNIVLKHQNKPGLITFANQIDAQVSAEKRSSQMNRILESLYAQETNFQESNYEELFSTIRRQINQRSLLLFYTNFETRNALYRQIKFLRSLAKKHVIVVIFFKNTELTTLIDSEGNNTEDIYVRTIGKKYAFEKELIVHELNQYGIHTILTDPKNLTIDTINKYLQLRSRGLIN